MTVVLSKLKLNCFMLQAVVEKTNVNPSEVGDIVVGSVLAPGSQRASECRMAAFYAGFPGMHLHNTFCIFPLLQECY